MVVEQAAEITMTLFRAEGLTVSFSRAGERAVLFENAALSLEEAAVYDLVGPSGSGKSTLLRACARMIERDGGALYLNGAPSDAVALTKWRRQVCLVPQKPSLVSGTVRDNLVLPWTLKVHAGERPPSDSELANLLDRAALGDVELGRDVSQLSGGQLARVALLRAFATKPPVLLLDEVDAALDPDSARAIGRLTRLLVGESMTCLRIRHRAADGFAAGTFELKDGALSYRENPSQAAIGGSASGRTGSARQSAPVAAGREGGLR